MKFILFGLESQVLLINLIWSVCVASPPPPPHNVTLLRVSPCVLLYSRGLLLNLTHFPPSSSSNHDATLPPATSLLFYLPAKNTTNARLSSCHSPPTQHNHKRQQNASSNRNTLVFSYSGGPIKLLQFTLEFGRKRGDPTFWEMTSSRVLLNCSTAAAHNQSDAAAAISHTCPVGLRNVQLWSTAVANQDGTSHAHTQAHANTHAQADTEGGGGIERIEAPLHFSYHCARAGPWIGLAGGRGANQNVSRYYTHYAGFTRRVLAEAHRLQRNQSGAWLVSLHFAKLQIQALGLELDQSQPSQQSNTHTRNNKSATDGEKFGHANDCLGFFSAPVFSSLLCAALLLAILGGAMLRVASLQTPTKFDSEASGGASGSGSGATAVANQQRPRYTLQLAPPDSH